MLLVVATAQPVPGASKLALKLLRVGADPDYRPITYSDKTGRMVGYDVDFATMLAYHLGIPLKYEGVAWDGIIPALQSGKIDAITNMVITDKRKEVVAFSKPYFVAGITTVVRADRPDFNPGRNDLAKLRVGVQVNTSASAAVEQLPDVKPTTYNTVADEYNDLLLGRLDVVVVESINAGYTAKAIYPGKLRVTNADVGGKPNLNGIALRKQDTELLQAVNDAIDAMIKDGSLAKVNKKWFGNLKVIPGE